MLWRVKFWLGQCDFCCLCYTERSGHTYWFSAVIVFGRRDFPSDARTLFEPFWNVKLFIAAKHWPISRAPEDAMLKIRRPVYKRLFKSRAIRYQKGDVNQTCQTVSRLSPIGACIRIWVHSACRGTAVPKVCLQALPLSLPWRFFHPFPN